MKPSSSIKIPLAPLNVIACGALAKELVTLKSLNEWQQMNISCLPAKYHNTPSKIPDAVDKKIEEIKLQNNGKILIAYGDCGTGGLLDAVIEKHNALDENLEHQVNERVERLPGAHCYQFFAGQDAFVDIQEEEIGSFYVTDFLVKQFDNYVWKSLGLDKHPELLELYFSNYKRFIYLAQTKDEKLTELAKKCAKRLGLRFERIFTGYGDMGDKIKQLKKNEIPIIEIISSSECDSQNELSNSTPSKVYAS